MAKAPLTPLERIKQLDDEKRKIMAEAKGEAMERVNSAIQDLNSLGFSYQLTEGTPRRRATDQPESGRKGTRQVNPDRPCPICGFKTIPPHDARAHRSQEPKARFTAEELSTKGYAKA